MKLNILIYSILIFAGFFISASYCQPHFTCTLANDSLSAANVYEFDIYMQSNDSSTIELADINFGFIYNPQVTDTGSMTVSWVPQSSELSNLAELPRKFKVTVSLKDSSHVGIIMIGPRIPPGHGKGSIISNIAPGTRIGRLRLSNSVNFAADRMNIEWNVLKNNGLYPTTVTAYLKNINTVITPSGTYISRLKNPVLK
ncbi:MAG: hypothetical protein P4L27_06105 [Ignavibacteriaceae bacterium]|nr:hypothetical protein [Ignavibacteriaceae bacterium]